MIRPDFLWFIPAIVLAFIQIKFIWGKLPKLDHQDTEIKGHYTELDQIKFDYLIIALYFIFWLQIGFPILEITSDNLLNIILKIIGYILIFIGFIISLQSLKNLGDNWAGMFDYKIKKNQKLVTKGIYSLVRHPIYLSAIIEVVGYELIANSWLALIFLIILAKIVKEHINHEELLLEIKFGDEYKSYRKNTKVLIPYLY